MQTPPPARLAPPFEDVLLPKAGMALSGVLHAGALVLAITFGLPEAKDIPAAEDIIEIVIETEQARPAAPVPQTASRSIAVAAPANPVQTSKPSQTLRTKSTVSPPTSESAAPAEAVIATNPAPSSEDHSSAETSRTETPANSASPQTSAMTNPGGGMSAGSGKVGASAGPEALPNNPRPSYPAAARRSGLEGRVVLRVAIDSDGRVADVEVLRSSGVAQLDRAAADALRRWRFRPAIVDGSSIAASVEIPVNFRLTD